MLFWVLFENYSMRWLSILGDVEYLGQIEYISKNLVLQALETIRIRFLYKEYFFKFHACVVYL